ncbi:enoyl-CoA hydratase-related protein [Sphingorhabdus sp.]|jgi:enoyl-CoA hydratase|uniref:enoyl-CoA hydratase-related protein n=1 Tax=Sphingorhabdus sp. TaxID=1902408 RepID=UPI003BB1BFE2|nr:enoyl-CoA hydratase/isomerase family protein [Sphingomonadales bacterium]MBK9432117.1 enoyl-CoA hydratase/isomerase family protein [Sphingomonadales bacterium]MBL0023356.1 enoyl-CoA hydratase/isomerase family protein [Sphingomonadales bacterium]
MSDAVLYDLMPEGIAVITINRHEQRNCLSLEVRQGLFAAWDRFENDDSARIAILTGSGDKAFCAGGDLKEMVEKKLQVPPRDMFPVPYENIRLSKPTIAAVNGVAFAGGWMIAQACDLCVASTNAKFAITEVKVGRGSPWATPLIHMIPQRIYMEIVLTGKPISAQRAYEIGLVNRLAEPGQVMDAALELAREVLEGAPLSVEAARNTVMLSTEMGRAAAIDAAYDAHEKAYTSEDAQEGPRAFAEKRTPVWKGR